MIADIANLTDAHATVLLCTFGESVTLGENRVTPEPAGFRLEIAAKRPRVFPYALPAVRALRRSAR